MSQFPFFTPLAGQFRQTLVGTATAAPDSFLAYINDDKIYRQTPEGPQTVGVVLKEYEALQKVTAEYHDELVNLGRIEPKLTQDEILQQQAEQLKQAQTIIQESARAQAEMHEIISDLKSQLTEMQEKGVLTYGYDAIDTNDSFPKVAQSSRKGVADDTGIRQQQKRTNESDSGTRRNVAGNTKRAAVATKQPARKRS